MKKTIKKFSSYSFTEKHSKFIGYINYIENKQNIDNFIESISQKHPDCNHIVYAYRLINGDYKYSDANEPKNSAGKPVYNVLEKNDLYNNMIIVIRYFGGIKLGIGGLIRAYSHTASKLIEQSEIKSLIKVAKMEIQFDYKYTNKILYMIKNTENIILQNEEYKENVIFTILVTENTIYKIQNLSYIKNSSIISYSFYPF